MRQLKSGAVQAVILGVLASVPAFPQAGWAGPDGVLGGASGGGAPGSIPGTDVDWDEFARQGKADVTREYESGFSESLTPDELRRLRGHRIVLVPGFLTDAMLLARSFPRKLRGKFNQYFDDQIVWLKANRIPYVLADIESEDTADRNGFRLREIIRASDLPVILIGHSKGGVDALHALINHPSIWDKVKGFVSLQAPVFGSPVADFIASNTLGDKVSQELLKIMGGSPSSLRDIGSDYRLPWMSGKSTLLYAISLQIPTVALASRIDRKVLSLPIGTDTMLTVTRDAMALLGIRNDGLVPWASSIVPRADYVLLEGMDHTMPVMRTPITDYDRKAMTASFLKMILARQKARAERP